MAALAKADLKPCFMAALPSPQGILPKQNHTFRLRRYCIFTLHNYAIQLTTTFLMRMNGTNLLAYSNNGRKPT